MSPSPTLSETAQSQPDLGSNTARRASYVGGHVVPVITDDDQRQPWKTAIEGMTTSSVLAATDRKAATVPLPARERFVPPARLDRPIMLRPQRRQDRFLALQQWEGTVTECRGETFLARLVDRTSKAPVETAEFLFEDVAESDRSLVQPGSVFYWSIGYLDSRSGQRSRVSTLRMRRLPVWSEHELAEAKQRADETREMIAWK